MAKQSVTLEVLSYHASASLEDAQRLRVGMLPASQYLSATIFKPLHGCHCILRLSRV